MKRLLRAILVAAGCAMAARAEVRLASLFTDGAVLQRDKPVAIWGQADAGEKVAVSFAGQTCETTAGSDGKWIIYLDALAASAQGAELIAVGKNTVTVRDVVVGEVWICSGQSNMEWPVSRAENAAAEIAAAQFPLVRHVHIEHTVADAPADVVRTRSWQPATAQNVGAFTAVGYFFAREIHEKTGVPIGIVHSSWGGTPIEAWMSPAALRNDPAFGIVEQRWQQVTAEYPSKKKAFDEQFAAWTSAEATARTQGAAAAAAFAKQNPRPLAPRGASNDPWTPGGLFNGMINPLLPYALRGVLWYQGENNTGRASEYHALFAAMITAWRGHFGQGEFPFYWVNLANFGPPADNGEKGRTYALLREAQTKTHALPNTGQAVAIDIGDPKNIHPANKQEVGRRLALLAKNRVYGIVCDDTGPTFVSATKTTVPAGAIAPAPGAGQVRTAGSKQARSNKGAPASSAAPMPALLVRFTHADGLVAHEKPVQSLEIAGADRVFYQAEGIISRDTLLVYSPKVREPVAVRYAFTNAPEANLFNGAGLPAVPFRSDDW
jgi:sialate O-acetylesterase